MTPALPAIFFSPASPPPPAGSYGVRVTGIVTTFWWLPSSIDWLYTVSVPCVADVL